jgi:aldose 1-epimerase
VSKTWALEDCLPTGEVRPVAFPTDFRRGRSMAGLQADDVYTGIEFDESGHATCRLIDEHIGTEFCMILDRNYRELVVFTPPGKPGIIAVEPYTQTTDAINLHARGIDGGLRILEPGASETMRLKMLTTDD